MITIAHAAAALRNGTITPTDLVVSSFKRMAAWESTLHAFVDYDEAKALATALLLGDELERGVDRGPLHGIPISIKDNIATRDFPTTGGSAFFREYRTGYDADAVKRLRDAGAIIVGKNAMHELALGDTNQSPVANPFDTSCNAGASSGGTAAAVAAGVVFAGIGSDSGGSVRIPSAWCGLVGLKPTYHAGSLHGLFGAAYTIDHIGPLARSVEDAKIMYEVVAGGKDVRDQPTKSARVRIGAITEFTDVPAAPEVAHAVDEAVMTLAALDGVEVTTVELLGVEDAVFAALAIIWPEVSSQYREVLRVHGSEIGIATRTALAIGELLPASLYVIAQRSRAHFERQLHAAMVGLDVLVQPTCWRTASPLMPNQAERHREDLFRDMFKLLRYTCLFNVTGYPAISMPCGVDHVGRPIGLQFVARPGREDLLLQVAQWYEDTRPWKFPEAPSRVVSNS